MKYEGHFYGTGVSKILQGDHSGCAKPPVDIKTKVAFEYLGLILKRNFCFDIYRRFVTTWMVTLYMSEVWIIPSSCCSHPSWPGPLPRWRGLTSSSTAEDGFRALSRTSSLSSGSRRSPRPHLPRPGMKVEVRFDSRDWRISKSNDVLKCSRNLICYILE